MQPTGGIVVRIVIHDVGVRQLQVVEVLCEQQTGPSMCLGLAQSSKPSMCTWWMQLGHIITTISTESHHAPSDLLNRRGVPRARFLFSTAENCQQAPAEHGSASVPEACALDSSQIFRVTCSSSKENDANALLSARGARALGSCLNA